VIAAVVGAGSLGVMLLFLIAPVFERLFDACAAGYEMLLRFVLRWRLAVVASLVALTVPAVLAARNIGQELFPEVDSGEFTVHMRATGGPRVEETERRVAAVERLVRDVVPPEDLGVILSNIGISSRWSAIYTSNNGPHAAFVRVQLRSGFVGRTRTTQQYVEDLRERLKAEPELNCNDYFYET